MRRSSFSALLLLAIVGSLRFAEAADLEIIKAPPVVPPPPRWQGFYVGINGGGGMGPSSQTLTVDPLITLLGVATTGNYKVSGALLGATLGYNYQAGSWVFGVEGDIDWSSIGGQVTGPAVRNRRRSLWGRACHGLNYDSEFRFRPWRPKRCASWMDRWRRSGIRSQSKLEHQG